MKRWPPYAYVLVSIASLLILIGIRGDWNPLAFCAGAAALVPLTAALLFVAAVGSKRDSATHARDPYPGIGSDTATPLGDTDQHSDAPA